MYHSSLFQNLRRNLSLSQSGQPVEIHHVVFFAENIREAALRNAPVQRHLATFKSTNQTRTRPRPLSLMSARGSLAHAGPHAASDPLLLFRRFLGCPYGR